MLFNKYKRFVFMNAAGDGGASGGGAGTTATTTTTTAPAATQAPASGTFSAEYVRELREENKAARLKFQEQETAARVAQEAATKAKADADAAVAAAKAAADERLLRAELKAIAIKAGIVDLDVLKLTDVSKLKLNDQGELENGDAFIEELKTAKPHFFGQAATSTSTTKSKPAAGSATGPVDVKNMNAEQYRAHKKSMGLNA